jgi:hypothetical protein
MPDPKYKTPNGKIVSERDLKEKYGTKFDSLVNANTFSLINENVYKTPNGTFEIESVLEKKYGDRFAQLVVDKTFELEDQIKKKEGFIGPDLASDMEQKLPIPPTQDGSLAGLEVDTQPNTTEKQAVASLSGVMGLDDKEGSWANKWRELKTGSTRLGESIASIPEAIYRLAAYPQNLIADALDIKSLKASPEKFKETFNVENPILDYYTEETDKLSKETDKFYRGKFGTDEKGNTKRSAFDSFFEEGEYAQGFELLGGGIAESFATSLAMMAGGASMSALKLTAAATPAFIEGSVKQLKEEDPEAFLQMAESEITTKAFGMAAAETVFMSIGTGTLGKAYKDIILKEGSEKGAVIFKQGIIKMYETAFKKFGAPISAVGEGLEEMATTITQNIIVGKDPTENVGESFLQGVGGGLVFGTPMTMVQAKEVVQNTVQKRNLNKEISPSKYKDLSEAFKIENSDEIDDVQISIASKSYSRNALQKDLKKQVDLGLITQEESEQSIQVFDKTKQAISAVEGVELTDKQKVKAVNLIKKKAELTEKVKDKDPNLVSKEINEIKQIDEQLSKVRDDNFLDLLTEEESLRLKDEAQNEIIAEYEADGVKDFEITDQEITKRAISIFERQEGDNPATPKKPVKTKEEINQRLDEIDNEVDALYDKGPRKRDVFKKLENQPFMREIDALIKESDELQSERTNMQNDELVSLFTEEQEIVDEIALRENSDVKEISGDLSLINKLKDKLSEIRGESKPSQDALNNKSNQNSENNEESNEESSQEANDEKINTEEEEDANQEDVLEKDSVVEPKKKAPKPTTTKRVSPKGVKGEFDVEIDSDGNVVSIKSAKDGRSISKFYEKTGKKTGKKTLAKNANYSRIENEALGKKTENQIREADKKRLFEALDSYTPTNEYEAALEYFANGGNIDLDSASKETGASKKELRWASGFKNKWL